MAANEKNALHLATHSGWYRYERRGENWEQTDRALTFWQMSCIQVDPHDAKHVYAGTEHSGMFVSKDGGKDWKRAEPNVPILEMSAMLALPGKVLVGTRPAALCICSKDGSGWQEVKGIRQGAFGGTFPPNPDLAPRTRVLTTEKASGNRLYAGIEVGGILVSDDDGESWVKRNDGLTDPDLHQILSAKKKPGLLVAACGEGVARSTDRGNKWEPVTPAGGRTYGNALAEDDQGQHLSRHHSRSAAHLAARGARQDGDLQITGWRQLGVSHRPDERRRHGNVSERRRQRRLGCHRRR